jgi:hypothetical protein
MIKLPFDTGTIPKTRDGLDKGLLFARENLERAKTDASKGEQGASEEVKKLTSLTENISNALTTIERLSRDGMSINRETFEKDKDFVVLFDNLSWIIEENYIAEPVYVKIKGADFEMQQTETTRGQWRKVKKTYPENEPQWNNCLSLERLLILTIQLVVLAIAMRMNLQKC